MASVTPNLSLLKKDPIKDGNDTFNIQTMLNDNWDKIDEVVGEVQHVIGNIHVSNATITNPGIVQLSNATDSDSELLAATPKAINSVVKMIPSVSRMAEWDNVSLLFGNNLNQYATNVDSNGKYTTVTYKRLDGSIFLISTASNPDTYGNYQLITITYYDANGTIQNLVKYSITFDSNGLINKKEVIS